MPIARDYGGLQRALVELLEEVWMEPQRQRAERMAEYAENAEEILAGTGSRRTLADGYYSRVGFLLELEAIMQLGVTFAAASIDMSEIHGLAALAAARRQFDALHPPCRKCGARLDNEGETTCPACWHADSGAERRLG